MWYHTQMNLIGDERVQKKPADETSLEKPG